MTPDMIIRAWKDSSYRASLTAEQRAQLPANPSGVTVNELSESELRSVVGGKIDIGFTATNSCEYICTNLTFVC
ncbi:mersacidin/lichenicidin family type 2 lantibiotic [Corallococcus aberystwythensis]|uniref:Mersacidin/lichenicidin family type 2 lantibiotic n=2 Tax=Corallococcus aberystwythensis TaxID=2316722 RepID=A0A3A8QP57_9BACT|nr:mersacidin/lichenicidin family type 2 lantibiotic [Corallococcus aberystwythensis]